MLLPGGLLRHGELRRRVRLRELDGFLELLIADAPRHTGSFHDGVSRVLGGLVDDVEGESFGYEAAGDLCVADRQFLMHRATTLLGMAHHWISTSCVACSTRFEVEVDFDVLPVGEAGPGPSYLDVEGGGTANAWTTRNTVFMTWNLLHLARLLKDAGGIPAYGNDTREWDLSQPAHPNPEYR